MTTPPPAGARSGIERAELPPTRRTWLPALAAATVGPMAGVEIALLSAPLGGVVGVPGAVVGYIAVTAGVLGGLLVLPTWRWRVLGTGRRAGPIAVLAGVGVLVAGLFSSIPVFTCGVLIAGAAAGPLLVVTRAVVGVRMFYGMVCAASIAGAVVAGVCSMRPGVALVVAGAVAIVAGVGAAVANPVLEGAGAGLGHAGHPRWIWPGYSAIGFALGGTVLPGLHLLLFRWNILDTGRSFFLAAAVVPALLVALAPGHRIRALAPLLILAAGGGVLVATAPSAWQTTIGIAVTATAAIRCLTVMDHAAREAITRSGQSLAAATALVFALGGFVGLGAVLALGRLWGSGSALTLSAAPVLLAALVVVWWTAFGPERSTVSRPAGIAAEGGT
ncbi:hypothetical protein K7711_27455 [Nocardia sp. CA2R105]|uniref:hypothetical protein n=1 Tax=Nocardia coffeae TaxID=2873381 RepID=UPI001CA61962|nr:hypothetical protein [Nocardia coffeae]MBY8860237.1 hypothetical protein [Nocardia coffeae]